MKFIPFTLMALSVLFVSNLYAHGEDHLGPNNGFIKMPGAFHTELVPEKDSVKIFLLDMTFQNPVTKDSRVSATMVVKGKELDSTCTPKGSFFVCSLPMSLNAVPDGKLVILAERDGKKGVPVTYEIPFELKRFK